TGNINTEHIKNHLTERTRLIVPVHYAGHPVDLDYIHKMAKEQNLVIIEDACHAPGAGYNPPTSPLEKGGKGGLLDRGKNGWI
ncbi:MAG: hypothetical protein GTN43_07315, partial [Candidatus Aenigmarchaeota archaeon]|nr:hypothetical protein [Candidatus Aenigmarchaeota archaeon]